MVVAALVILRSSDISLDTRYPKMLKKSNSSIMEFKNSGTEGLNVLIIKEERRVKFGNSSIGNQTGEAK